MATIPWRRHRMMAGLDHGVAAQAGGKGEVMVEAPFGLSDKEREVLRLLARGHDTKSAAATLRLSVHTVNERLREARLKTRAGSSRAAARLLAEQEDPEFLGPSKFVVPDRVAGAEQDGRSKRWPTDGSRFLSHWGIPMLTSAIVAAVIVAGTHADLEKRSTPAAPHVVSTSPAPDAVVGPGQIALSVTFDRPMRRQSYSFVRKTAETYPECDNRPEQSTDRRTFRMICNVKSGRRYEIWFNSPPYLNFVDDGGAPAIPHGLRFRAR